MTEYSEILSLLQSLEDKSTKKEYVRKVIITQSIISVIGSGYVAYMPNYNPSNYVPNSNIPCFYAYRQAWKPWKYLKSKHPYFVEKVSQFIHQVLENLNISNTEYGIYTIRHL